MKRDPIFAELDAMNAEDLLVDELIAAGWGDVPRRKIPENWRDIPREVKERDLERIRAEELTPEKERIEAIERSNVRVFTSLVERVTENERRRRPRTVSRRRFRRGTGRGGGFKKMLNVRRGAS